VPTTTPIHTATTADSAGRNDIRDRCQLAFALGWHIAELAAGAAGDGDDELVTLTAEQRRAAVGSLAQTEAQTLGAGSVDTSNADAAHAAVLTALLRLDYRLAKAYLVGRGLCRLGAEGPAALRGDWVGDLRGRISDLKSCFQPYATDAVVATLRDWRAAALRRQDHPDAWTRDLKRQVVVWRALLSGEKLATDYVQMPAYVAAAQRVTGSIARMALGALRTPLGLVLVLLLMVVAGVFFASLHNRQTEGVYSALAAGLAWLGISGTTVSAAVRKVLGMAEDALWQAEMAAAVALAITRAPRESGNRAVRELAASSLLGRPMSGSAGGIGSAVG
jgi:hypothetical protein